jgi:hypothetical protein
MHGRFCLNQLVERLHNMAAGTSATATIVSLNAYYEPLCCVKETFFPSLFSFTYAEAVMGLKSWAVWPCCRQFRTLFYL